MPDAVLIPDARRASLFLKLGTALLAVWVLSGLTLAPAASALETLEGAGLLAGLIALLVAERSARAPSAERRLICVVFCAGGLVLLAPPFHRSVATGAYAAQGVCSTAAFYVPFAAALALWLAGQICGEPVRKAQAGVAADAERFLAAGSVRLNLAVFGAVAIVIGLALAGLPYKTALWRGAALAAIVFALKPLLQFARLPQGRRAMCLTLAAGMLALVCAGSARYLELWSKVEAGNRLLSESKPQEAGQIHEEARALNKIVAAKAPELAIETNWARYFERTGALWESLTHWNQVADMQRLDRAQFAPALRLQCRLGDSVTLWRRFIFQGFAAVRDPELLPGIKALGETASEPRAAVLAALLAWELNDPPDECRRRLEQVQRVAPNEPSSHALLRRMGVQLPNAPLKLPMDLLVAPKPGVYSALGTLDESDELRTVAVLDKGHWEIALNVRGTPLNEEWPIMRVDLDEHEVGRTQVTHCDNRDVVFTFDVNRGNLYRLRVVFQNRLEEMSAGRLARRCLVLNSVTLRRAAD